jgi:hypothetical protein
MKGRNVVLALVGTEFFPLLRVMPGRLTALLVFASLCLKQFIFQYAHLPPACGTLLHVTSALSALYLLLSLVSRTPAFDGGLPLAHLFGASRRVAYLIAEPLMTVAVALALILPHVSLPEQRSHMERLIEENLPVPRNLIPSPPQLEPGFAPWWRELGVIETDVPLLPPATDADRAAMGLMFLLVAWLGFLLHARTCDWPQSAEYRELRRREQEARDAASGRVTFYAAGDSDVR